MRALDRGEEFVVTRNGVPVADLTPLRRRRWVSAEAVIAAFASAPPVDYRKLQRDLDSIAGQDPTPDG